MRFRRRPGLTATRNLGGYVPLGRRPRPLPFMLYKNTLADRSRYVKLRYVGYGTMNPAAAVTSTCHVFRLNSLYDPDYTGAGHQPYGYDQMSTFWTDYRVVGVRWKLTMDQDISNGTAYNDTMMATNVFTANVTPRLDLTPGSFTAGTAHIIAYEQPLAGFKYKRLFHPTYANGKIYRTLKGSARMRSFYATQKDWDDNGWGNTSSSPVNAIFLQCGMFRSNGGAYSGTEYFHWVLKLEFIAQFAVKKKIAQS